MDGHTLSMSRTFDAPPQRVFEAWTSAEVMRRWWHAGNDWETSEASVDLRIGGAVRVVMRNSHQDAEYGGGGEYTEIDPPRRLAFTWEWDDEREQRSQVIEIDFVPEDGGRTTVHFTHRGLWDEATVEDHEDGWGKTFANLERDLRKERGGREPAG